MGRDRRSGDAAQDFVMFQSTRPRGARRDAIDGSGESSGGFNPRARVGRDMCPVLDAIEDDEFQSTRPRGARRLFICLFHLIHCVSIHAPAWGATDHLLRILAHIRCFNPRARVGRDR